MSPTRYARRFSRRGRDHGADHLLPGEGPPDGLPSALAAPGSTGPACVLEVKELPMTRYLTQDRVAIVAAVAVPLAAAVILLPWRGSWSNTNVALLLVVVVVAVAAIGNRVAGALAALGRPPGSTSSSPCPTSGSRSAARPTSPRSSCCWP